VQARQARSLNISAQSVIKPVADKRFLLHACSGEYFFIPCLIANPPTSKSGDLESKYIFIFYLFSDLRPKKMAIFIPLHHLHCKYGAPKQAKHEQINVFRPVSEQNFIPEYIYF
jgi:hypothetical protein